MANEAYINENTTNTLKLNGEPDADYVMDFDGNETTGLPNTGLQVSAQVDLGSAARESMYNWSLKLKTAGNATQYSTFDLYIAKAPEIASSQIDGNSDVTSSAARLTDGDIRYALTYIGSAVCTEAETATFVGSGSFETYFRYVSFVVYNGSGQALSTTDGDHALYIEPVYYQGQ